MFSIRQFVLCFLLLAANVVAEITFRLERVPLDKHILISGGIDALDVFHVMKDGNVMLRQELDIMIPLDQFSQMVADTRPTRRKKAIMKRKTFRWPASTIHYEVTESLRYYADGIRAAMNTISNYTCLSFVETEYHLPRIQFNNYSSGCNSYIGYAGSIQYVNLGEGCDKEHIIQHEILHALGIEHEQMRRDRDNYLELSPELKKDPNWALNNPWYGQESFGIEYDYRSIMHFYAWDGVKTKDPSYQHKIGRYNFISFRDIQLVNAAYCSTRFCLGLLNRLPCPFNGMRVPRELYGQPECQCWCDSGKERNQEQFVLCSSLETSMEPVYNLTLESSLLETEHKTCTDLLDNCTSLKENGFCFTELVKMKNVCTKTCKFCDKVRDLCMDNDESCAVMAEAGVCKDKGLEEFMNNLCPKSCGQCTQYLSACDIQNALEEPHSEIVGSSAAINSQWITIFVVLCVLLG